MIIYYSGGDAGITYHPEVYLPGKVSIMLSYQHLTKEGHFKYRNRFKQMRKARRRSM